MESKIVWFLIFLIVGLLIFYVIGAFISMDPLWFISTLVGRIFGSLIFISCIGAAIKESTDM
jgi:uncharacterized membrane protein required for colicin V production